MKIAVVNWTTRRVGGAEAYLGAVVPALRARGYDLFFWSEFDEPTDRQHIAGLDTLPAARVSRDGFPAAVNALRQWSPDVLFCHGLTDAVQERELLSVAPSVYFGHNYYGTCISGQKTVTFPDVRPCTRRFGPMCLVQFYPRRCGGLSPLTAVRDYRRQSMRLDSLRQCQTIVTFSEHMRREYLRHGFGGSRVHKLPAVVISDDAGSPHVLGSTIPDDAASRAVRIAFIGRLDRLKGCRVLIEALIEAARRLDAPIELTVAGDGPDRDRCQRAANEAMASATMLRVRFAGWLSQAACDQLLSESDLLAIPSLWPEPFGLVGPQAVQRGVPVVAFAVGGIPEWLENGTGGILAPADPPTPYGLAAAIVEALTSRRLRDALDRRRRSPAPDDSLDRHVAALVPILQSAAGVTSNV